MAAELHIIFERRPWSSIASRPALNSNYGISSISGITPKEHATRFSARPHGHARGIKGGFGGSRRKPEF
jgi:hypothetical protein